MGSKTWGNTSVVTALRSMRKRTPIGLSRRGIDTESSRTDLDDFGNFRESLRRLECEAFVPEDCVPLLVDFVRMDESLDDLVVRHAKGPGGRRGADREERVPHLLPVPAVKVHHHDRPNTALLAVQRGLLRDSIERVGEF